MLVKAGKKVSISPVAERSIRNKGEAWKSKNSFPIVKFGGGSIMLLGSFV